MTDVVPDLTQRIVAAIHPLRVILFGSAARGEMKVGSDLDVLVVVPDGTDVNAASKAVYRGLRGLGYATDALVVTEGVLSEYSEDPWLVYRNALREGRDIYRASA